MPETVPLMTPWPHVETLTRLGLALAVGLFVGLERERRGKEAGLRTFGFAALLGALGGMLGDAYEGYFPHGDAGALAQLLLACRASQLADNPAAHLLGRLAAQCALRSPLFEPAAERNALLALLQELEHAP